MFRGARVNRELDDEMDAHIEEAIAQGRDASEARFWVAASAPGGESRREVNCVARFIVRRRDPRLAAAHEKKSDARGGLSIDRRTSIAPFANRSCGPTLLYGSRID